jgi:TetR/AcrR family transcriptional regulator
LLTFVLPLIKRRTRANVHQMSYIAARRVDEKERRRAEIVDAAEALYVKTGWTELTIEQVARRSRLSRALVYVYFRDKEDLLFAIGERAIRMLRDRFVAAVQLPASGMDQVEAIGRAYLGYAYEFPHYFDFCSRLQSHSLATDPNSNEGACKVAGDQAMAIVVNSVETGIRDGSIRADVGDPMMFAITLRAFTHGVIQLAMAKGADLARRCITIPEFNEYAFLLLRRMAQHDQPTHG